MTTARLICIGTHHKTGTVWMRKVWKAIAHQQGLPYLQVNSAARLTDLPARGPAVCVNWSGQFPDALWNRSDARFLHVIRDPRDILLSGMRYHRIAPLGNEKFLRVKRADLGGLSYQEHINALPDDASRLLFEMMGKHDDTVTEMLAWPYGHPRAVDLRYEDLITDHTCARFRTALTTCAIDGLNVEAACQTFWDHALFGGLADARARSTAVARHVTSGAAGQWRHALPRVIAEVYSRRYAKALRVLGYAQNRDWVTDCAWHPKPPDSLQDRTRGSSAAMPAQDRIIPPATSPA